MKLPLQDQFRNFARVKQPGRDRGETAITVDDWARTTLILTAGCAAAAVIGSALVLGRALARRWRSKSPEEIERLRRQDINRRGRIAAAEVVDLIEGGSDGPLRRLIVYRYEVAGVVYEAAQEISGFTGTDWLAGLAGTVAGAASSVKYDPHKPTNSIIACEGWTGLRSYTQID